MTQFIFPHKRQGDSLGASHVNDLGRGLNELSTRRPGTYLSGRMGENQSRYPFDQRLLEITNLLINDDDTTTSGLYLAREVYYSFDDEEWKLDFSAEWEVDARGTYLSFEAYVAADSEEVPPILEKRGHRIAAYWDEQRGAFVPITRVWPSQERKVKLTQAITSGSYGTANVWENGILTSPLQTIPQLWLNWMTGGEGALSGTEAIARWFDDERKWVAVNLEC